MGEREGEGEQHQQAKLPAETQVQREGDRAAKLAQLRLVVCCAPRLPFPTEEWIRLQLLDGVAERAEHLEDRCLLRFLPDHVDAHARAAVQQCSLPCNLDAAELWPEWLLEPFKTIETHVVPHRVVLQARVCVRRHGGLRRSRRSTWRHGFTGSGLKILDCHSFSHS